MIITLFFEHQLRREVNQDEKILCISNFLNLLVKRSIQYFNNEIRKKSNCIENSNCLHYNATAKIFGKRSVKSKVSPGMDLTNILSYYFLNYLSLLINILRAFTSARYKKKMF